MIGRLCLGLTLPLVVGAVQPENLPPGWRVFTSKEGGFSVALPGPPAESKQRVATATGHLDVYLFLVEGKDGTAYVVSYSDLPADEVKPGSEEKRLDFAREGAVANARGKLRTEKKVELDGCPGRELVIETDKDVVIRMRVYAAKRRLYQAMAMGPGGFSQSKDALLFLDSLRLVK
jgi:hypothetical protein